VRAGIAMYIIEIESQSKGRLMAAARVDIRSAFTGYLRAHGLNHTAQRTTVLDEILKGPAHFEVEEVVDRVRRRRAGVSRATVYRTVNHLERANMVRKMDFDESHAHFEIVSEGNHHEHLLCERCGRIVEFADSRLERRIKRMAVENGMVMTKHFVQIIGVCKECVRKEKP
jgi:Fur family ferric uptake transcriptional regulator